MTLRTACCLALTWAYGCAQSTIPPFSELDENGDGRIEAIEVERSPALRDIFVEVDADSDGELTVGEYMQAVHRL